MSESSRIGVMLTCSPLGVAHLRFINAFAYLYKVDEMDKVELKRLEHFKKQGAIGPLWYLWNRFFLELGLMKLVLVLFTTIFLITYLFLFLPAARGIFIILLAAAFGLLIKEQMDYRVAYHKTFVVLAFKDKEAVKWAVYFQILVAIGLFLFGLIVFAGYL